MRQVEPTPIERDVLLCSSGELAWWKRRALARRLRHDPEARRLAESLTLTALLAHPEARRSIRRQPRSAGGWTVIAAAASLAIGLGWWQMSHVRRSPDASTIAVVSVRSMTASSEPLHRTSTRLRLRSSAYPDGDTGGVRVAGLPDAGGEPPSWSGIPVEVSARWLDSTDGEESR